MSSKNYEHSVFINCPFDSDFQPLFDAIVFTVHDCGFIARCAREIEDGSQVRIDKVSKIISECRFGIHDISRTALDPENNLPRFNMPLELGLDLGAKVFGGSILKRKSCLILDIERHRYQKFISDIAGQDVSSHNNKQKDIIRRVRDWLSNAAPNAITIPGGAVIHKRYKTFRKELPKMCKKLHLKAQELTFNDYVLQAEEWLKLNRLI